MPMLPMNRVAARGHRGPTTPSAHRTPPGAAPADARSEGREGDRARATRAAAGGRYTVPRALSRWLLAGCLCGSAIAAPRTPEAAPVYPEPGGQGPVLPFIGADGLGQQRVTRSDVVARLGPAEAGDGVERSGPTQRGGPRDLRYPSRGLHFEVNADDRTDKDPLVGWLQVELPFDGRTPQGLYLGMPKAQAMAIVEQHYRVRYRIATTSGFVNASSGEIVGASNRGWRKSQSVRLSFRQGRLHAMDFQLKPEPWISARTLRELRTLVLTAVVAGLAGLLIHRLKRGMGVWWWRGQALLGILLLGGGALVLVGAAGLLSGGDGYARMAGLVLGLCALGAMVVGLAMLAGSWRRRDRTTPRGRVE